MTPELKRLVEAARKLRNAWTVLDLEAEHLAIEALLEALAEVEMTQ